MLNQSILMGRLTRDVELRYSQGGDMAIARFTLAVDRDFKTKNEEKPATDFISCKAFGKTAEFVSKYFRQGSMLAVVGSIQTGSYDDKDGKKVYTTDVVVNKASFTGEKADQHAAPAAQAAQSDGFMNIPKELEEELPFN